MWAKIFSCKESAKACFLRPQHNQMSSLLQVSHGNNPFLHPQSPTASTSVNVPCTFCHYFPHCWALPLCHRSQVITASAINSILICLHCLSKSFSLCGVQVSACDSFSAIFATCLHRAAEMSPLHWSWKKGSCYTKQLQLHLAQQRFLVSQLKVTQAVPNISATSMSC